MFDRKLILVHGKGGVGKTSLSKAIALFLSRKKQKKTLWVNVENPLEASIDAPLEFLKIEPLLTVLNLNFFPALKEYLYLKLKRSFLVNMLIKHPFFSKMVRVVPGLVDLVLMGKVWYEMDHFDAIVLDMPSTGHGLSFLHSMDQFARIFGSGILFQDAFQMKQTFENTDLVAHVVVTLLEALPVQEALECLFFLKQHVGEDKIFVWVNQWMKDVDVKKEASDALMSEDAFSFLHARYCLQKEQLDLLEKTVTPSFFMPVFYESFMGEENQWKEIGLEQMVLKIEKEYLK